MWPNFCNMMMFCGIFEQPVNHMHHNPNKRKYSHLVWFHARVSRSRPSDDSVLILLFYFQNVVVVLLRRSQCCEWFKHMSGVCVCVCVCARLHQENMRFDFTCVPICDIILQFLCLFFCGWWNRIWNSVNVTYVLEFLTVFRETIYEYIYIRV